MKKKVDERGWGVFFMEMKHFSGEIPFELLPVGQDSK